MQPTEKEFQAALTRAGHATGSQVAAAISWLWPQLDTAMAGEMHKWSDEELLTAHCTDWLRGKALSLLRAAAAAAPEATPAAPAGKEPDGDGGEWALRRLYDYTSEAGHYEAREHILRAAESLGFFIADVD